MAKETKLPKRLFIGQVLVSKDNDKEFYIKTRLPMTIEYDGQVVDVPAGTSLNMQRPSDEIAFLLENNYITELQAEERLEKTPDFVRFNVTVKTNAEPKQTRSGKSKPTANKTAKKVQDDDLFE